MPLKICFVASEIAPLAKTGGLADVAGVLPRHLHALGHDVRVFMPLYSSMSNGVLQNAPPVTTASNVSLALGTHRYTFTILESRLPNSAVPLYLVHCPEAYDRPSIYTLGVDEHLRFLVLQSADPL
jgi:starch synthase